VWSQKNLISINHTIKDVSILCEWWLDLVYKEVDVRAKPVHKNFGDDLEDDIEEINKLKIH